MLTFYYNVFSIAMSYGVTPICIFIAVSKFRLISHVYLDDTETRELDIIFYVYLSQTCRLVCFLCLPTLGSDFYYGLDVQSGPLQANYFSLLLFLEFLSYYDIVCLSFV